MLLLGLCRAGGCTQCAAHPASADGHGDNKGDGRAIRNAIADCYIGANTHRFFSGDCYQHACAHPHADGNHGTDQYARADGHLDAGHADIDAHPCDGDRYRDADCNFDTYSHTYGDDCATHANSHAHRQRDAVADGDPNRDIYAHSDGDCCAADVDPHADGYREAGSADAHLYVVADSAGKNSMT